MLTLTQKLNASEARAKQAHARAQSLLIADAIKQAHEAGDLAVSNALLWLAFDGAPSFDDAYAFFFLTE